MATKNSLANDKEIQHTCTQNVCYRSSPFHLCLCSFFIFPDSRHRFSRLNLWIKKKYNQTHPQNGRQTKWKHLLPENLIEILVPISLFSFLTQTQSVCMCFYCVWFKANVRRAEMMMKNFNIFIKEKTIFFFF